MNLPDNVFLNRGMFTQHLHIAVYKWAKCEGKSHLYEVSESQVDLFLLFLFFFISQVELFSHLYRSILSYFHGKNVFHEFVST